MESCPSLGGEFDQLDCLLGCDEFVEFDGEDLCSSVVEQVLGFCSDGDPDLVAGDAWFGGVVEEEENSSETTARPGRDRARTLVSERRRRGRMKDKLYELRSMVPNITKMDKASIIGDAISYVKDLQKQARMLTEEIARLESSAEGAYRSPLHPREREKQGSMDPLPKRAMLEFSGCGLGDKRFHLRLVCQNGEGTPAAVYRALEKLTFLHQESSTLSTCSEKREVTLTVKVAVESRMLPVKCSISSFRFGLQGDGYVGEIDVPVLKPWVMTALLDEGFGFNVEVTP